MTIQRQYSLPNCKLILEGLSDDSAIAPISTRPLVSRITNVECHIAAYENPLVGGRDFLESLVKAVSDYAQEYLSGMSHAPSQRDRHNRSVLVQLQRIERNLHRLIVQPQVTSGNQGTELAMPPAQLDLTTVQLFDLVEAVDQFFADAQTLPELSLKLSPLPKRHAAAKEPAAKRAVPAVLGVSGLAVAALALFFVPAPQPRRPQPASETKPQESSVPAASPSPSPSPSSGASTTPSATPSGEASAPVPAAGNSPIASTSTPPSGSEVGTLLSSAPEITDQTELSRLTTGLYDKLDRGWTEKAKTIPPTFKEPLIYRVGVSQSGEVLGYKFVNDAALNYLAQIPLADLRFNNSADSPTNGSPESSPLAGSPTDTAPSTDQPIAQFRVVFKPNGILEVSPWYGEPPAVSPSSGSSPEASPSP